MNFESFFSKLIEHATEEKERTLEKSIPMRKEWLPMYKKVKKSKDECLELVSQLKKAFAKSNAMKKGFWSQIEQDLEIYDREMSVNHDDLEIEIYAEDKE